MQSKYKENFEKTEKEVYDIIKNTPHSEMVSDRLAAFVLQKQADIIRSHFKAYKLEESLKSWGLIPSENIDNK